MTGHLTQVQRDGDRFLSRHDRWYRVRLLFWLEPPLRRWEEDYHIVPSGDFEEMVRELPRLSGPVAVTFVDERAGTAKDVSKEAALRVAERIRDGDFSLTDDLRNFIEEWHGVGSVIPAAA